TLCCGGEGRGEGATTRAHYSPLTPDPSPPVTSVLNSALLWGRGGPCDRFAIAIRRAGSATLPRSRKLAGDVARSRPVMLHVSSRRTENVRRTLPERAPTPGSIRAARRVRPTFSGPRRRTWGSRSPKKSNVPDSPISPSHGPFAIPRLTSGARLVLAAL